MAFATDETKMSDQRKSLSPDATIAATEVPERAVATGTGADVYALPIISAAA